MISLVNLYHSRMRSAWFWLWLFGLLIVCSAVTEYAQWPHRVAHVAAIFIGISGPLIPELLKLMVVMAGLVSTAVDDFLDGASEGVRRWQAVRRYREQSVLAMDHVQAEMRRAGVSPNVVTEITSLLLADLPSKALGRIVELRANGVLCGDAFEVVYDAAAAYVRLRAQDPEGEVAGN